MRANPKTIKLAKIRRYIREAIKWYKVDKGMPEFYTSENYRKSKRVKNPKIGDYPYYVKSDEAIRDIAEKIYNLMEEQKVIDMEKIPNCPKCGEKMMEESNDDEYFWYCPDCDVSLSKEKQIEKPKVICLCGSTRFTEQMLIKQWELTKQGNVVLSWCALPDNYFDAFGGDTTHIGDKENVKEIVDEVHKRKIDLADEVFVINVDDYIGDSTKSEVEYAMMHNKPVKWLEPHKVKEK